MIHWLTDHANFCQAITSIMTAIISVAAIFVSVITYRSQKKFNTESVKPLLSFELIDLPNRISVKLRNDGQGVAKITSATFSDIRNGEDYAKTLLEGIEMLAQKIDHADSFTPENRSIWKRYLDSYKGLAVSPNSERVLIEMEFPNRREPSPAESRTLDFVRRCLMQLDAAISYTDIHDHRQPPLKDTFDYFGQRSPFHLYSLDI